MAFSNLNHHLSLSQLPGWFLGLLIFLGGFTTWASSETVKPAAFLEVVCSSNEQGPLVLFDWAAHKFIKKSQSDNLKPCLSGLKAWLTKYELDWMSLVGSEQDILSCLVSNSSGCGVSPSGIQYPERSRKQAALSKKKSKGVVFEVPGSVLKNLKKQGFTVLLQDQNKWPLKSRRQLGAGVGLFLRWGEPLLKKHTNWVRVPLTHIKSNLFQLDRSVWLALRGGLPEMEKNGRIWISGPAPKP